MRILSLVPAATEILYALDHEPIGTSHECDYPPEARSLPSLTASRIDPHGTPEDIHEHVGRATETQKNVFDLDVETIVELDPDLVISQGTCSVCAIDHTHVERALAQLDIEPNHLATHPHTLADVFTSIERIGTAIGKFDRAATLVDTLRDRKDAVADHVPHRQRPTVAVFDWADPVLIAGHWIPELVHCAGGSYALAEPGDVSRHRPWQDIRIYDPDHIIIAPCGFSIDRTIDTLDSLLQRTGWNTLDAVRNNQVVVMDGNHYVNRPGPRLVDTLEAIAGLIHPESVDPPSPAIARPITDPYPV